MAKLINIHRLETKNDFWEADEMLSLSDYTEAYDSEDYYKERSEMAKKFVATYEVAIDRVADYEDLNKYAILLYAIIDMMNSGEQNRKVRNGKQSMRNGKQWKNFIVR